MAIVSIIIPVYKVEPYIERCVQSVMAQTYTDIECILVDDCSPDQSIAICERMLIEYHGPITFQILHHEQNRGLSAARNTGTNAANSDYIFYLDSDDEITHDCISLLVKETERHPGVELVQGGIKAIPYDDFFNLSYYQQPGYYVGNDWIRFHFFKAGKEFPVMAWNKLILRDFLKKNHFVFKEGLIHEDELWMLQLAKKLDKIAIVGEPTYFYYKTSNSIMSTLSKQHSAHHMLYISRVALQGLDEPYKMLQLFKYLWILVDRIGSEDTFDINVELSEEQFRQIKDNDEAAKKALTGAMVKMLGIRPKIHLLAPKSITRSEGKAVRVIDKRKLHD